MLPLTYLVEMITRLAGSSRTSDLARALISSGLQWLPQLAALIKRSGVDVVMVGWLSGCDPVPVLAPRLGDILADQLPRCK